MATYESISAGVSAVIIQPLNKSGIKPLHQFSQPKQNKNGTHQITTWKS